VALGICLGQAEILDKLADKLFSLDVRRGLHGMRVSPLCVNMYLDVWHDWLLHKDIDRHPNSSSLLLQVGQIPRTMVRHCWWITCAEFAEHLAVLSRFFKLSPQAGQRRTAAGSIRTRSFGRILIRFLLPLRFR
jgi:hypothetical protein